MILALLLQGATATAPVPASAPWTVNRATTAKGSAATSTSVWSSDGKARLVVRCDTTDAPIVSIQFIPKAGFPAATPRPVSINIDDNGWLGTNWQFPGNGAFVSDDTIVTNLAAMIARAKSIRVRVIDPDNSAVDAVFTGPPGEASVRAVLNACGYEFGVVPPRSMAKAVPASKSETTEDQ